MSNINTKLLKYILFDFINLKVLNMVPNKVKSPNKRVGKRQSLLYSGNGCRGN